MLGGNQVSGRVVTLQRRASGATTWITVGAMPAGTAVGTYVVAQRPTADMEYRAVFATQTVEGLEGSASAIVRVSVDTCPIPISSPVRINFPCF